MQGELDKDLLSLFQEQRRNLSPEPFLSDTLHLVKKRRVWRMLRQNLILLIAVSTCALLSRFLIQGSILLAGYLDWIFKTAGLLADRPAGMLVLCICAAVSLLIFRRRIFAAII